MSRRTPLAVLVLMLLFASSAGPAHAAARRVSMKAARHAALARVPGGTVQSAELEREHGRLIYSFDIKEPGKSGVEEVHVDAHRGNVIAVQHENAVKERTERVEHKVTGKH